LIMEAIFSTVMSCALVGSGRVEMLSVQLDELIYRLAARERLIDPLHRLARASVFCLTSCFVIKQVIELAARSDSICS
jgi:hypothetical protein